MEAPAAMVGAHGGNRGEVLGVVRVARDPLQHPADAGEHERHRDRRAPSCAARRRPAAARRRRGWRKRGYAGTRGRSTAPTPCRRASRGRPSSRARRARAGEAPWRRTPGLATAMRAQRRAPRAPRCAGASRRAAPSGGGGGSAPRSRRGGGRAGRRRRRSGHARSPATGRRRSRVLEDVGDPRREHGAAGEEHDEHVARPGCVANRNASATAVKASPLDGGERVRERRRGEEPRRRRRRRSGSTRAGARRPRSGRREEAGERLDPAIDADQRRCESSAMSASATPRDPCDTVHVRTTYHQQRHPATRRRRGRASAAAPRRHPEPPRQRDRVERRGPVGPLVHARQRGARPERPLRHHDAAAQLAVQREVARRVGVQPLVPPRGARRGVGEGQPEVERERERDEEPRRSRVSDGRAMGGGGEGVAVRDTLPVLQADGHGEVDRSAHARRRARSRTVAPPTLTLRRPPLRPSAGRRAGPAAARGRRRRRPCQTVVRAVRVREPLLGVDLHAHHLPTRRSARRGAAPPRARRPRARSPGAPRRRRP